MVYGQPFALCRDRRETASPGGLPAGGGVRARRFVIATGSRHAAPPVPGLAEAGYLTNETISGLHELPGRLVALGGGRRAASWRSGAGPDTARSAGWRFVYQAGV
jgi:hypothetical protein